MKAPPASVFSHISTRSSPSRIKSGDKSSYTVRLAQEGVARVRPESRRGRRRDRARRDAAKDPEFAGEAADLLYHLIVLLRVKKLSLTDAIAVLEKRHAPKS